MQGKGIEGSRTLRSQETAGNVLLLEEGLHCRSG